MQNQGELRALLPPDLGDSCLEEGHNLSYVYTQFSLRSVQVPHTKICGNTLALPCQQGSAWDVYLSGVRGRGVGVEGTYI